MRADECPLTGYQPERLFLTRRLSGYVLIFARSKVYYKPGNPLIHLHTAMRPTYPRLSLHQDRLQYSGADHPRH